LLRAEAPKKTDHEIREQKHARKRTRKLACPYREVRRFRVVSIQTAALDHAYTTGYQSRIDTSGILGAGRLLGPAASHPAGGQLDILSRWSR
jgi:hypothetical protein